MSDEDRWEVKADRRAGLAAHSTRVHNDGRGNAVLYYPGSGADILHPLFAAGRKARYFVFVDPLDLDQAIPGSIKEKHSRLSAAEARPILTNLNIRSQPTGTWMFSMQGATRFLFHFRQGHDEFLRMNRGFECDIVFEKDFWETPDDIDPGDVLNMLRVGGHYSTNASLGLLIPALALVGLDFVDSYHVNGDQYLFQRRGAFNRTWASVKRAVAASTQVIYNLICDDTNALSYDGPFDAVAIRAELLQQQNAILAPFAQQGIVVPAAVINPLCRQIAVKAVGNAVHTYIEGIELAFGH